MKKVANRVPCRSSAKPVRKGGSPGDSGRLTGAEIRRLVLLAKDAYSLQDSLGNLDPGETFDAWRRAQVQAAAGVAGTSKLVRRQWRTVAAHFLTLAGKEDKALALLTHTGPKTDHGDPAETHESCEEIVADIHAALADHSRFPESELVGERIHAGWLVSAARQRTGKPTLRLDEFATRLDTTTLHGLRCHLRNYIAEREGRDDPGRRSHRSHPPKPDPGDLDPDAFV